MILLKLMEQVPFFSEFTVNEREVFVDNNSYFSVYESGQFIVSEDDAEDNSLYIIMRGKAIITKGSHPGKVLDTIKSGAVIGEISFLTGRPRTANVIADGKVIVFRVDRIAMDKLACVLQLKIRDRLIEILVDRLDQQNSVRCLNKPGAC